MQLSLSSLSAYLTVAAGPAAGDETPREALGIWQFMDTLCDWVWELCLSLVAGRDSLGPDFIAECRRTLRAQRRELDQLPRILLALELDITGFTSRLSRFDDLLADFERIAASLAAALPSSEEQTD